MRKAWAVMKREYLQRVRSRSFVVLTALGPALMVGYFALILFLARMESTEIRLLALWSPDAALAERISQSLSRHSQNKIRVNKLDANPLANEGSKTRLFEDILKEKLNGYLYIPAGVIQQEMPEYYSASTTNVVQNSILESALSKSIVEIRLGQAGIPSEKIQTALRPVSTKFMKVTKGGTTEESKQSFMAGFIFIFMLYIVILIYGVSVMRSVIEEKSSRIVEVILSSLRPMQLLLGKIIGVGAAGLTQVGIWVAASSLLTLYGASAYRMAADSKGRFDIPFPMLGYFLVYFTLGFILFSTLYATVGSMVNTEQEAQHYQMPVMIGLILPMILLSFIMKNPNSPASIGLSLFPLFCPILMFMRIVIQPPPFWQIALSIVSMLLGIWVCTWISAKIYRVGILMYGKPPSLPEILRWIRYS